MRGGSHERGCGKVGEYDQVHCKDCDTPVWMCRMQLSLCWECKYLHDHLRQVPIHIDEKLIGVFTTLELSEGFLFDNRQPSGMSPSLVSRIPKGALRWIDKLHHPHFIRYSWFTDISRSRASTFRHFDEEFILTLMGQRISHLSSGLRLSWDCKILIGTEDYLYLLTNPALLQELKRRFRNEVPPRFLEDTTMASPAGLNEVTLSYAIGLFVEYPLIPAGWI